MTEEDNIFDEDNVDLAKDGLDLAREREKNIVSNVGKFLVDAVNLATEELTVPVGIATGLFNFGSSIVNGPPVPNIMDVNNYVKELAKAEYDAGPAGQWGWWGTAGGTGIVTGGIIYDKALNKIKAAYPKIYANLVKAFPYSVGQIHGATLEALKNTKNLGSAVLTGKNPAQKAGKIATDLIKRIYPDGPTRFKVGANAARIVGTGAGAGMIANLLMSKPTGGEGLTADNPSERLKSYTAFLLSQKYGTEINSNDLLYNMQDSTVEFNNPELVAEIEKKTGEFPEPLDTAQTEYLLDSLGLINEPMTDEESMERTRKINEETAAEKERYERLPFNRKVGEYLGGLGEFAKDTKIAKAPGAAVDFLTNNRLSQSIASAFVDAKTEEEPYDMLTMTPEYIAEDAKDKAENEQYMIDKEFGLINQAPFVDNALEINLNVGDKIPANMRVDNLATGGEPGLDTDIFDILQANDPDQELRDAGQLPPLQEFTNTNTDGPEQIQLAGLVGKAPLWAIGNVDKIKILDQPSLSKNEKKILKDIESKLGSEEEVTKKIQEDLDFLNTPKTIIDSPETSEAAFYSGLEARLMDPNTPKTFNSTEDFYKFLQNKQISKKEIDDNILDNYLAIATKNKTPLVKEDMLKIVRQAPMRKVDSIVYGNANYGGEKNAIYTSYKQGGEIPGSYRESVLYLDPKYIPQDPDSLPRSSHDFTERYVIGWSRKTDREATLPVDKTAQGIAATVDPAMIRTLKRNSTKLKNQLKGLEASAYEKIRRAPTQDLTPIEEMNPRMITETINSRMTFLEELDAPLANQIRQFRSKIQDDSVRLGEMEAATKGQKTIVTFADEIQSDILQQAKELENELRASLGKILDLPVERRAGALAAERTRYSGSARNVEPEVLDFYTKNETIFRPMFNTAEEMQSFVDEFQKNKVAIEVVAKGGPAPSDDAIKAMNIAIAKEKKMLEELNIGLSEGAMKQLFPNVPFKNRDEWGDILVKRDLTEAAQRLFIDKVDGAAQWYAVSPADLIKKRYAGQGLDRGGTNTSLAERQAAKEKGEKLKGIGVEEFYGGPNSVDTKGKHYTSSLEKSLKRAAKENNSEFKIIEVDGIGKVFAIKLTPEMLLPHKTHRKDGGMVYTPEIIDIFEAA